MRKALQQKPIATAVVSEELQFYKEGVINRCEYSSMSHGVLLVGFDIEKGWKFKNSWGERWGENGYGWLKDGNTCGVCNYAISASLSSEYSTLHH